MIVMEIVSTIGTSSLGRELDLKPLISDLRSKLRVVLNANFRGDSMIAVRLKKRTGQHIRFIKLGRSKSGGLRLKQT